MEKVTDRILWSILVLAIGVSLFVFGKPAYQQIVKSSTQQLLHSTKQWEGATLVDEQFAAGNDQRINDGELTYQPRFNNSLNEPFPFQLTISNGVYHISSDSTMEITTAGNLQNFSGFYVWYSNDHGDTFDTGDKLHATIEVKGHGTLRSFGFEMGTVDPVYPGTGKVIDTHGKWETISYTGDSYSSDSTRFKGLNFYVYRNPNTDLYVRNLDVTIN